MSDLQNTVGAKRVRMNFNVAEGDTRSAIDEIKEKSAELINLVEALPNPDNRLKSLAMTSYEEGAMWAVKAATADKQV